MVAAIALAGGCARDDRASRADKLGPLPSERDVNSELANLPFEQQIAAGAVADRTIYDHHFAGDGLSLNALGERQIDMLLEVATDQPIRVNVPNTGSKDGLHEARVAVVRERFLAGGVDEKRLQIVDVPPGGPGISTEIIIRAMEGQQSGAGGTEMGTDRRSGSISGSSPGRGGGMR